MPVAANTNSVDSTKKLLRENIPSKYFIIRNGTQNAAFSDLVLDEENNTLAGKLKEVEKEHQLYLYASNKKFEYEKADAPKILNEVHLYINSPLSKDSVGKSYILPVSKIDKIEVVQPDTVKTHKSKVTGMILLGVVLGVVLIIFIFSIMFISEFS